MNAQPSTKTGVTVLGGAVVAITAWALTGVWSIRELRNRIGHVEMKEKILIQYALSLREHIDKQLPPPPPAWPVFPTYTNHDQP